jgi:putative FmdB family regulatory protein
MFHLEEQFMPIYEYRCADCDHQLEVVQKLSEDPIVSCPECKNDSLKRIISAAGFRLKGDGWYETDFKSGKKKNVAGSESGASNVSSSGDS